MEKVGAFHESPSPKKALCQVWFKLVLWLMRRRFLKICYFRVISPWNRVGPFIRIKFSLFHPRMPCAKFGWNWYSGSWEEDFLISLMCFCFFCEIGPVVLEKKMKMWKQRRQRILIRKAHLSLRLRWAIIRTN